MLQQQIKVIQAAPGIGKTQYIYSLIAKRIREERFIVALRDCKCADIFVEGLLKILSDEDQQLVDVIYTDKDDVDNTVSSRLDAAIMNDQIRLIVICQKALDSYQKWHNAAGKFTLFIDELFDAAYWYQKKLSPYLAEDLGISKDSIGIINIDTLRKSAKTIYEQSYGNAELHNEVMALLESLMNAEHVSIKVHKDSFKVITFRESRVFSNLKYFRSVYLSGMIIKGTLPHLIGSAKGFEFVNSDWERQGDTFTADDRVAIIPLMKREASQSYLNDPKQARIKNFEKMAIRAIDILASKNIPGDTYMMTNKDVKGVRDRINLIKRRGYQVVDMGFNTHGQGNWMDGRKFCLLFTSRWNRDFNLIGEEYSKRLGIDLSALESAYEVTMQLEPIAQAATRGQVRQGGNKPSWIVVLDVRTANYLKDNVLHRACIDSSHLAELTHQAGTSTGPANAGIKSLTKRKWGLSDTQAKAVERRCKKHGCTNIANPEHLRIADQIVMELYPELMQVGTEFVVSKPVAK